MNLEDFDFDLPKELIAYYPLAIRDMSRLLVVDNALLNSKNFVDIADYFHKGDVLVLNDSKVIKARLVFGGIEFFIHKIFSEKQCLAFCRPFKKINKEIL